MLCTSGQLETTNSPVKGLESLSSSNDSAQLPNPIYNTMGTVSVTLYQCIFTNISHTCFQILDCSAFDIVELLLHHGNVPYSFMYILFQFWWLYFCWNIKYQFLIYWCSRQVMHTALVFRVFIVGSALLFWFLWIKDGSNSFVILLLAPFLFCCMFTPSHSWAANR